MKFHNLFRKAVSDYKDPENKYKKKGLSINRGADLLGITRRSFMHYKSGKFAPNVHDAAYIAKELDFSLDDLKASATKPDHKHG